MAVLGDEHVVTVAILKHAGLLLLLDASNAMFCSSFIVFRCSGARVCDCRMDFFLSLTLKKVYSIRKRHQSLRIDEGVSNEQVSF